MKFYVYHYCDPESGTPFYVGKGKGRRAFHHLNNCKRLCDSSYNTLFYRKLRKMLSMGINPDIKIVKDQLEEKEAFDLEISDIKHIGRRNLSEGPLTNLSNGGDGPSGFTHSEKAKQKIREAHLDKPLSEDHCRKIGKAHLGMKRSEKTKQRIGDAQRGKPKHSMETRKKLSEHFRGKSTLKKPGRKCPRTVFVALWKVLMQMTISLISLIPSKLWKRKDFSKVMFPIVSTVIKRLTEVFTGGINNA